MEFSPSGKLVCQSEGSKSAEIVLIGESPAQEEMSNKPEPKPFVGRAGKLLNSALRHAGIDRSKCYVMNCVPVRAPHDKFAEHNQDDVLWAKARFQEEITSLSSAKVYVCLGANPTEWMLGGKPPVASYGEGKVREGFIGEWRGSALSINELRGNGDTRPNENYLHKLGLDPLGRNESYIVPTYHPAAVLRQFTWHPWLIQDLELAGKIARGEIVERKFRKWFYDNIQEFERLAISPPDVIAIDTENDPQLINITTSDEVHVFEYSSEYLAPLKQLLESPHVMKVAHNWLFDYAWFRKKLGLTIAKPIYDTLGGAHILSNGLEKSLSPHIATRFTHWPYHKWLVNVDPRHYNGMDGVVCYDAYWPQIEQLFKRKLQDVAFHDHKLFTPLLEMQATGFRIDEETRKEVEKELGEQLGKENDELTELVLPVIKTKIDKFQKPHLFRRIARCPCCLLSARVSEKTGARVNGCWRCSGLVKKPSKKADYLSLTTPEKFATMKKPELHDLLVQCKTCNGTARVLRDLPFNADSPDQVADVIYRGLGIRARKFKGKETIKASSLDAIKDKSPIIAKIVEVSKLRADWDTVNRLEAGYDGLLHCEFDPFGTGSGRVAGKEGLLEVGTNPMNLPKKARRFVVPRAGKIFLYPDMSAIEARAIAVLSKDKRLIQAFMEPVDWPGNNKHGKFDCHTKTVQLMLDAGTEISRDQSKVLIYGGMYGGGPKQLASEMNANALRKNDPNRVTEPQVAQMLDIMLKKVYVGVDQWRNGIVEEILRTRKVRCPLTGREREWLGYVYDKKTKSVKHEIVKQGWSFLPQHLAAWVLADGLIEMFYESGEWGGLLQPLIHVHDAILMEAPIDRIDEAKALATKLLTRTIWGMTFESEMKVGTNWEECS